MTKLERTTLIRRYNTLRNECRAIMRVANSPVIEFNPWDEIATIHDEMHEIAVELGWEDEDEAEDGYEYESEKAYDYAERWI